MVKIGLTTDKLTKRLDSMQSDNWCDLEVIHTIYSEDVRLLERQLHEKYAPRHIRGEWFALEKDEVLYG